MALDNNALKDITEDDLHDLILNKVPEDKTIDYKQTLQLEKPSDKKEVLKDISAFANTLGGHIVYGMKEEKGIPVELCGMEIENPDEEIQRLDNLIRYCIDPRIYGVQIRAIKLQNEKTAIIFRIPRSFNPPHMVKIDKYRLFYGRNSSGSYPLNVDELRILFGLSDTIIRNARDFRAQRLSKIEADHPPVPLLKGPKYVLHMVPFGSFRPDISYDLSEFYRDPPKLPNIRWRVSNGRFNFDGFVSYHGYLDPSKPQPTCSYTQFFRNGIIEAIDMEYDPTVEGNVRKEVNINYENRLTKSINEFLKIQTNMGISPPFFLMVSLLKVKGIKIVKEVSPRYFSSLPSIPFEQDNLILPEIIFEDIESDVEKKMLPIFDIVLNSSALTREDIQ